MGSGDHSEEKDFVALRENRRKNLRSHLLVLKIRGEDRRGVFFGYAKTIGKGGMFIASVNPRDVGESMEISFTPPGYGKAALCTCEVMWRRGFEPGFKAEPGMGIKFTAINSEVADEIDKWVLGETY